MPSSTSPTHEITVPNWALNFSYLMQTEKLASDVSIKKGEKTTKFTFEAENGITESENIYNRVNLFFGQLLLLQIPHDQTVYEDSRSETSKSKTFRYEVSNKPGEFHQVKKTREWTPGADDVIDLRRMNEIILDRDFKELERLITERAMDCGLRETPLSKIPVPSEEIQMFMAVNAKDIEYIKKLINNENRHLVNEPMIGHEHGIRPLLDLAMDNDYESFATLIALGADSSLSCGRGRRDTILNYVTESGNDTDQDIVALARSSVTHKNALDIIHEIEFESRALISSKP